MNQHCSSDSAIPPSSSVPSVKPEPPLDHVSRLSSLPTAPELAPSPPVPSCPQLKSEPDQDTSSSSDGNWSTSGAQAPDDVLQPKQQLSHESMTPAEAKPEPVADEPSDGSSYNTDSVQRIVATGTPEVLEAAVQVGVGLLDNLTAALTLDNEDVKSWAKSIKDLKERAKPTKTIVGVVGNTGAGKSTVINALMDENRLLPTNCMRACTASPTEVSYNYSQDPNELYRAEIEFISAQDWEHELGVLFNDLLDGNGDVSRDCTNSDSDAGVAYAKLKAVYPNKTKEMLAAGTPERYAKEPAVRGVLGSVKKLKATTAGDIFRRMQHYVDSKEKERGDNSRRDLHMEYWPLIKVVRIYTKADALSTGAVIVDLPGVQDSNAARAAVAANYMKLCTGLWIVAPINRAVDDKTAKTLLGDTFKRQLKYDGTYSAVTFICSKTDDINVEEASLSLGIENEISESFDRSAYLKRSKLDLKRKLGDLRDKKAAYTDTVDQIETKWDAWDELRGKVTDGQTVYAPVEKQHSRKRKRQSKPLPTRKNLASSDVDDDSELSESDCSDEENSPPAENRLPLTEADIDKTLASLKAQKKQIREDKRTLESEMREIRKEMDRFQAESDTLLGEMRAICVKGRNDYSRGAIKQDFAMGIKELDQENAIEEDETTFDPDHDLRDYDEVANSLPVFCVSSRAYQAICGRFEKENIKASDIGFMEAEDTEIPQLQRHAKKLTEAGRASNCRRFLNDFSQLINSMRLWASSDDTQSHLTDAEKRREETFLRKLLQGLEDAFENSVKDSITSVKQSLDEHIFESFNATIPRAVHDAINTASGWGAHRSMGGMYWATYKATVRRNGVYSGASGPRDFNQELFDPISRDLATGWERAFQRRLPIILEQFAANSKALLSKFHQAAVERAQQRHTNVHGVMMLSQQILAHIRTLSELPATLKATITDLQREASREFVPVIMEAMRYAYYTCTEERGSGSYARMKTAMVAHVETSKHTMFRQACDTVKTHLEAMCRAVQRQMNEHVENIFDMVFRDYTTVLVGTRVDRHAKITLEERAMRRQVNNELNRLGSLFRDPFRAHKVGHLSHNLQNEALENEMKGTEEAAADKKSVKTGTPPPEPNLDDEDDPFDSPKPVKTETDNENGVVVLESTHSPSETRYRYSSDDEKDAAHQLQLEALQADRMSQAPDANAQHTPRGDQVVSKHKKRKITRVDDDFPDIFDILEE